MTSEKKTNVRICDIDDQATGKKHDWSYNSQVYTCLKCGVKISKDQLKENTD